MKMSKQDVESLVKQVMDQMGTKSSASLAKRETSYDDVTLKEEFGEGGCLPCDYEYGMMSFGDHSK